MEPSLSRDRPFLFGCLRTARAGQYMQKCGTHPFSRPLRFLFFFLSFSKVLLQIWLPPVFLSLLGDEKGIDLSRLELGWVDGWMEGRRGTRVENGREAHECEEKGDREVSGRVGRRV